MGPSLARSGDYFPFSISFIGGMFGTTNVVSYETVRSAEDSLRALIRYTCLICSAYDFFAISSAQTEAPFSSVQFTTL